LTIFSVWEALATLTVAVKGLRLDTVTVPAGGATAGGAAPAATGPTGEVFVASFAFLLEIPDLPVPGGMD
jgi:hypothetical protein